MKAKAAFHSSFIVPPSSFLFRLRHTHTQDAVAAGDAIHCLHALRDATEDGVAAVEVRLWRVRNEPLRAAGVFARQGHADRAAVVGHFVDLAANLIAGAAVAVAAWVAALDDEVGHDAVERD